MAGVSTTTVSLALNDHPRISRKTRARIMHISEELRYRPNYIARSLVSRRSNTLGLVITSILNPFFPELAKGIEDKAMELGYNIILCSTSYDSHMQQDIITLLRSRGVDGIVFASVEMNDPDVKSLLDDNFPFVLVNRTIKTPELEKRIDCVAVDNVYGGYLAIQHLHRMGHRRIGIIAGSFTTSTAAERTEGAKKAMSEWGLAIAHELIVECHFSKDRAYEGTRALLSLESPPTAIFAENDFMALGVREAVFDAGLTIPGDIALVGFDDIALSAVRGIEMTTISQKKYEMGAMAVEMLIRRIEDRGAPVSQITLQPDIVIRKSCGYQQPFSKTTEQKGL